MSAAKSVKQARIKVGAEDAVRVTVGQYGAVVTGELLSELGFLKNCSTCFNDLLTSLYSCVIERAHEEREGLEGYRKAVCAIESIENLRRSLSVISRQSYYDSGEAVYDGDYLGEREPDEDTAVTRSEGVIED